MVCVGLTVMASAALADEAEPAAVNTEEATFVDVVKNVSSTLDGIKTVVLGNEKKDIFQKNEEAKDLGSLITGLAENATAVTVKNAVSGAEEQAYESVRGARDFLSSNSDVNGAVKEAASGPRSAIDSVYDFAEEQVANSKSTVADTIRPSETVSSPDAVWKSMQPTDRSSWPMKRSADPLLCSLGEHLVPKR